MTPAGRPRAKEILTRPRPQNNINMTPSQPARDKILSLWAGWAAEMCTKRDLYEMKFPAGATSAQKCTLLGCAHLIDLTVKEQEGT